MSDWTATDAALGIDAFEEARHRHVLANLVSANRRFPPPTAAPAA